ncbi:GAF domain-containing protein [Rhizobium sp.]
MPDYQKFVAALEEPGKGWEDAFAALETLTREKVGVKLFTVMTADTDAKRSRRIYSNMPDAYPVSGTKPYNETHWSDITLKQKRTFVANTIEDIAGVFDDHELIKSLGCESVINVPVIVGGDVIATINCLHEKGHYTEERVKAADALKLPGAVCVLLHEKSKGENLA